MIYKIKDINGTELHINIYLKYLWLHVYMYSDINYIIHCYFTHCTLDICISESFPWIIHQVIKADIFLADVCFFSSVCVCIILDRENNGISFLRSISANS